jgi:hypothetical protein
VVLKLALSGEFLIKLAPVVASTAGAVSSGHRRGGGCVSASRRRRGRRRLCPTRRWHWNVRAGEEKRLA